MNNRRELQPFFASITGNSCGKMPAGENIYISEQEFLKSFPAFPKKSFPENCLLEITAKLRRMCMAYTPNVFNKIVGGGFSIMLGSNYGTPIKRTNLRSHCAKTWLKAKAMNAYACPHQFLSTVSF